MITKSAHAAGPTDQASFGKQVLGPIFADFSLNLWTLLANLETPSDTTILFCARGGLRLRLIYERFLQASGLQSPVVTDDLMVSRIVAVRAALLANSPSAYEQIGYEMGAESLGNVALAISGIDPGECGHQEFTQASFTRFLASDEGSPVRASIQLQADFFQEHLASRLSRRSCAILCDSGLSGSTMQLLEEGIPYIKWGCVLFARSNYKKLSTPHFPRTVGLAVEADCYSPFNARTAVLRYWHLIEATLEPALRSVSSFERVDGSIKSNLETYGWRRQIAPLPGEFLAGVLAYLDELPGSGACVRIMEDVGPAYRALRRAIVWPTAQDVDILDIGNRSVDFGRPDDVTVLSGKVGLSGALWGNLWREGAVVAATPSLRRPVLAGIEAAHTVRWAIQAFRK